MDANESLGEAIGDYERVLNHWEGPLEGKLTAFHESILPKGFKDLIRANEKNKAGETNGANKHCTWDNSYISLYSGNAWASSFISRIGAALFGGLALVVPMLIMSADDATTKNLVTTCVAVFLVAVGLASVSLGSWKDVIGLTAAYAAVLVVFIGTSTATSPVSGPSMT